jgi:DNA-binding NarL/FixJ family response regulator
VACLLHHKERPDYLAGLEAVRSLPSKFLQLMLREKLKVLIVEDSEVVTRRIRSMLKEMTHVTVVGEAINGTEALAITDTMDPDVVLLDIHLPGMNGVEILKEIKLNHGRTCVMMLTNYSDLHHRKRCKEAGADYFFDKSIEFEKVPDVLTTLYNEEKN